MTHQHMQTLPILFYSICMARIWLGQCFNVAPAYYDAYEAGDTRRNVILTSYVVNDANRTVITRDDIGV